jgi:serine/threonine-protein kinase
MIHLDLDVDLDLETTVAPSPIGDRSFLKPHAPPSQLPAICTYGRYEILGRVAFGGMAEIFLGRENLSAGASRMLVIKRILPQVADDPTFVEMFLDEARLAIQLSHPNICHIYEFGEVEGTYFIAMEWIHGASLGKIIRRAREGQGLAPELVAKIIVQVAEALEYAHHARDQVGHPLDIVHRDVTPHNIMVSHGGQVKLLDFGIAKAASASTKTEAGIVKGKFAYMSPQQCLGRDIDGRADVFALGVCLYEALTGSSLYQRATDYETMKAVIEEDVPSIRAVRPELPVALDAIVQRALQKSADERWAGAGQMQQALEDWLASIGRAVPASKVAELMAELFRDEAIRGPLLDSTPFGQSFKRMRDREPASAPSGVALAATALEPRLTDPDAAAPSAASVPPPAQSSRARRAGVAVSALALLVAVGGGAWLAGRHASGTAMRPAPSTASAPATARDDASAHAAAEPTAPEPTAPEPTAPEPTAPEPTAPAVTPEPTAPEPTAPAVTLAPPPSAPAAQQADRGRAARPPGLLSIDTRPWSKVYVGSRLLGTTPIAEAEVQSGTVRLRLVDRDGRIFTRTITVPPHEEHRVFYELDE